jgi:monoamine oxidase
MMPPTLTQLSHAPARFPAKAGDALHRRSHAHSGRPDSFPRNTKNDGFPFTRSASNLRAISGFESFFVGLRASLRPPPSIVIVPQRHEDNVVTEVAKQRIAIVGGGISGLYCARVLIEQGREVHLFETAERLGGRIRTERLNKNNQPLKSTKSMDKLEFYVEYGPMRVELDKQLLLEALLHHLEIDSKPLNSKGKKKPYLKEFPAYSSPGSPADALYELKPEEKDRKPLELLRMALLRIMLKIEVTGSGKFGELQRQLQQEVTLAGATGLPLDEIFIKWLRKLGEDEYWAIQTTGTINDGVPLYSMGFWNLLSDWLSHSATLKLRDLGTFYHLLPENPNAAEWLVWWLIGLSISANLHGIFGGMEHIIERLVEKLDRPECRIYRKAWVTAVEKTDSRRLRLRFHEKGRLENCAAEDLEYDHVILALPKKALNDVVLASAGAFAEESEAKQLVDSAFGFPMVKAFFVVKHRWWEEENRANLYATRVPTRELHYWKGQTAGSKQGLIMLYTDAPAATFWANYVPPGPQIDANQKHHRPLAPQLQKRFIDKVVRYINDNNVPDVTADDIVWYGIRDWGREPYGGANHAWRPERKFWVVMRRLADIPTGPQAALHICGEAYSDYHGFIEGSLRSSTYVLHRILDRPPNDNDPMLPMPWLGNRDNPGAGGVLTVKPDYLESLRAWAKRLDDIGRKEEFMAPSL